MIGLSIMPLNVFSELSNLIDVSTVLSSMCGANYYGSLYSHTA
ncbi:hypothetical protein BN903_345 [Halorubrum sp. AJ67]|nr:hypothetical protein BN903_345 [Halorubrum sp. AJ67]